MIITTKNGDMVDTGKKQLEVSDPEVGKEAQYHLRQFIKCMKQLGRYC